MERRVVDVWDKVEAHVRMYADTITAKQAREFAAGVLNVATDDLVPLKKFIADKAAEATADEMAAREACTALLRVCKKAAVVALSPTVYATAFKGRAKHVEHDLRQRLAPHNIDEHTCVKTLKRVREKNELAKDVKDLQKGSPVSDDGPRKARKVETYTEVDVELI